MPSDRQPRKIRMTKGNDPPDVASSSPSSNAFPAEPDVAATDALAATARREATLLSMLDSLPTYILQIDTGLRVTFMNERFTAVSGYHLGETLPFDSHTPHPFWFNPDTHAPYYWNELPAWCSIREGRDMQDILVATTQWGAEQTFLARSTLMRDDQGVVTHALAMLVDITSQRQAEIEAQQQAQTLNMVIETIADGIIICDAKNGIKQMNPVAQQILGLPKEAKDLPLEALLEQCALFEPRYPNGKPYPLEMLPPILALQGEIVGPVECIVRPLNANGDIRIVVAAAPLNDPATHAITGAVVTFHDASERYRLERMREQFISAASHELRTPLNSLILVAYVMEKRVKTLPEAAAMGRFIYDINAQIKRMEHVVDNLLDFTALIRGQLILQRQQCDLTEIVHEAVEMSHATRRCDILFSYETPLMMIGDPERLSRVFETIIAFGCASSSQHHPARVTLERRESPAGVTAHLVIQTATAPFVAPPQDVMDRFATGTLLDPYAPGTLLGEGLYLSSSIIEMHGGGIEIHSVPGQESRFAIRLPLLP